MAQISLMNTAEPPPVMLCRGLYSLFPNILPQIPEMQSLFYKLSCRMGSSLWAWQPGVWPQALVKHAALCMHSQFI